MQRLSQNTGLIFIASSLIFGLSGCSGSSVKSQFDVAEAAVQTEVVRDENMAHNALEKPLGEDLLFNLLAGEFAGVRGEMTQAIRFYEKAAALSGDPQIISRAAYVALYAGDYARAIELTDRWLTLKLPKNETIERIRVISFLHLEELELAVQAIERVLIVDGLLSDKSISPMTHILSKETTPVFAHQVVKRLDEKHPQEPFLLMLLAKFEANLGEYESALLHINQLIELDNELADAYLIKAQIHAGMGEQLLAINAIAKAVEYRPQDIRLRLQYGRMLVRMKMFDKALAHFKALNKTMPNDENVLLSLGLLSIETDDNHQAKLYLQELLDNGYRNQQARYYLGRIQQNDNEDMAAIANYERVLSGDYWLDARLRVAGLLAKSGDTEKALLKLESLNKQGQNETTRVKVFLAKGEVLRSVSRNKEAFSLYNNALQLSPENTDLLYARALTAEKLNLLDVTESDLKMVIMHEPENASALNALGYTLADRTERLNEAREYIFKAAQLLPDDPAILDSLGWVHYRLGQYQAAIKWLNKAFEQLKDAEIAAHLGEVLWMDGQTKKAKNIWNKGKKLNGNQAILEATIERFRK
ncbi:FIG140336: TPR domain protein [hydrothermal vent metagenome]|uniref:FIG140336: TPR domain protein n=1 Tax=hydrothermal vent metagenome TaxID=652676 RepID=A0A3B0XFJ2_9ZZZZ